MTTPLPSSGVLRMSDLKLNMEITSTDQIAMDDPRFRALANKKTGQLKLSDFYGMNELESLIKAAPDDNGAATGYFRSFWGEIDKDTFDTFVVVAAYDSTPDNGLVFTVDGDQVATLFHGLIINNHIYYESDASSFAYDPGSDTTTWVWADQPAGLAAGTVYELSYLVGSGAAPAATLPVGQGSDWTLVFEDTFSGATMDFTKWNRAQWYLLDDAVENPPGVDNFDISSGRLRIWPVQNAGHWVRRDFTTDGIFQQAYGYWEIKCKIPVNVGFRCLFWLLNHDTDSRPIISAFQAFAGQTEVSGWNDAAGHAVDYAVLVQPTTDGQVLLSSRYRDALPALPAIDLTSADHVFGIKKDESSVSFFLDGTLVFSQDLLGPNVMTLAEYMNLSLDYEVGSDGVGPDGTTIQNSSAAFEIDYVRAWSPGITTGGGGGGNPVPSGYVAPLGVDQTQYPYLTFREEFDTTSVDTVKWNTHLANQTDNGKANIAVGSGAASLWPATPFATGKVDFNATLDTDGKFYQKYGFFEVRAKVPTGRGVWPAAWLFNHDLSNVRPAIAMMEMYPGANSASIDAPSLASQYDTRLVTDEFWGMHMSAPTLEPWPLVSFKTYRTWDAYPGIAWADINTSSGVYDWSHLDGVMSAASAHTVDLVYTFGYVPTWVNGSQTNAPTDAAWTDFVTAITARYPQIKYWQIWNEPNSTTFWTGTTAQMAHMAALAAPIIRAAGGIVLSPCPQGANAHTWHQDFFANGAGPNVDVITFNSYTFNAPETLITNYANLLSVLSAAGQTGKEIWDTEHSWGDNTWPFGASDDLKKAYLARLILLSHSLGITRSIWYSYDNFQWGSLADRNTDTLLPAGTAYLILYIWIAGKRITKHTVTNGVYFIDIAGANGYRGRIVWNDTTTSSYSGTSGFYKVHTLEGTVASITPGSAVSIGIKPVLLDNVGAPTTRTWGDASLHPINYAASVWSKNALESLLARTVLSTTQDLSLDWHTYGLDWKAGSIQPYFDGVQFGNPVTFSNDMDMRMYILLTNWLGSISGQANDTETPVGQTNSLMVDYVRAWARADGTTTVEGTMPVLPEDQGGKPTGGTTPTPPDIVEFYGDSTTYGYKSGVGTQVAIPYPTAFAQRKTSYDVRNKGINSTTSTYWINGTNGVPDTWANLMAASPAKYVCIMLGVNDQFDLTTTAFKANLKTMVASARSNGKIPLLITPFVADWSGLPAYAQAVRDAASESQTGLIEIFNWSNAIVTNGTGNVRDYVPDGTHPNDQMYIDGGAEIARVWDSVINGAVTPPTTTDSPAVPAGHPFTYTKTFEDLFDGSTLNQNLWNTHIWWNAAGEEDGKPVNYQVSNGELHIWPMDPFAPRTIDTDGKFYQTFGFFEMEAKLPVGRGCWPAFWLYNHDGVNNNPDARPEIDIMEAYSGGGPDTGQTWADSNLHPIDFGFTAWKQNNAGTSNKIGDFRMVQYLPNVDLSAGYHKYGLLWETDGLTLFFDGQQCGPKMNTTFFQFRMYILLDLYFGDASGSPSDAETPRGISNAYSIRYVRAWRKN